MEKNIENATKLIIERLDSWFELIVKNLPNLIVAIIVITLFVFIAKLVRRFTISLSNKKILSQTATQLLATTIYLIIVFLGIFISLGVLNLDKTVTSLLAGAGVIGLAIGFAFQEIAANFVSGVFIAIRQPYQIGDIVEIDDMYGEVSKINLRTTSLVTFQGIEIFVPNKSMFTKPLKNYTTTPTRRLDIDVGISYNDDLEFVEKLTTDTLSTLEGRTQEKPIEFFYKEFGASSINFEARIWINYPDDNNFMRTRHAAIIKIKKAFDKNNISIPFPIRTIEMADNKTDKV